VHRNALNFFSRLHGGTCQKTVFVKYRTWEFPALQASVPVLAVYSAGLGQFATVGGIVKKPILSSVYWILCCWLCLWCKRMEQCVVTLRYVFDFLKMNSKLACVRSCSPPVPIKIHFWDPRMYSKRASVHNIMTVRINGFLA